jgi:hypothetical protein
MLAEGYLDVLDRLAPELKAAAVGLYASAERVEAARVAVAPALQAAGVRRLGLRPRAGGANAAGTRVTATLADGRSWMREVNGGGGYGSQSTSTLAIPAGVSEVTVRWPDGTSSRHPVSTSGLLRQP